MLMFLALENQAYSSPDASELTVCSSDSRFCDQQSVEGFKYGDDFLDKFLFFLAFLKYRELERLDEFLSNGDGYCKECMI